MAACLDKKFFYDEADKVLRAQGLQADDGSTGVKATDIENIVECVGSGYGVNTPEELGKRGCLMCVCVGGGGGGGQHTRRNLVSVDV